VKPRAESVLRWKLAMLGGKPSAPSSSGSDKENDAPAMLNNKARAAAAASEVTTPALAGSPVELTARNSLHAEKNNRRIRFMSPLEQRIGSPASATFSPDATLTPPPKEFVRTDYRTMRAGRCLSAVVTDRDLAEAAAMAAASPRPPTGIVQQMRRLYSAGSVVSSASPSPSSSATGGSGNGSSPEDDSQPQQRKGLFRSRSWSLRRRRSKESPPKRCSPGSHSQDSGISECRSRTVACGTSDDDVCHREKVGEVGSTPSSGRSQWQPLKKADEEEEDPNLTQMPSSSPGAGGGERTICRYAAGKEENAVTSAQARERLQVRRPHKR